MVMQVIQGSSPEVLVRLPMQPVVCEVVCTHVPTKDGAAAAGSSFLLQATISSSARTMNDTVLDVFIFDKGLVCG